MKKFLIGLVCGIMLAGLAVVIVVFSFIRMGERRPDIADGSTLVLQLSGDVPEQAPVHIPIPMFQSPMTVIETWDLLRKAAVDTRIKAVVFEPGGLGAGWGKVQEIRESLLKFKRSGKPLIAFLRGPGLRQYYLATAADRIYVTGEDFLDLKGMRAELIYLGRTLDKIGVEFEVEHAGKYKDAADMFTRTSATPETLEVMNSVLDEMYGRILRTIAEARGLTVDQVRAALDEGPLLAEQAKAKKLVDGLLHRDEVYDELRRKLGQGEIRKLPHRQYARIPAAAVGLEGRQRIAVIVGQGIIARGSGQFGQAEDEAILSEPFIRLIRSVSNDNSIRGVVVRVDSPGGDAVASDDILHELRMLSRKKPMVISMSDLAASGGYYISMTGDPVVAYPATMTGSIGVIYGKVNMRGLYDKLGIQKQILKRGRFADIDSDYEPLSADGRKKLREGIDKVYESFLARVAEGRRKKRSDIEPLAQGRVWLGSQARENGLIDETGGIDRALELVRKKANIAPQEKVRLVMYPPRRSIFDLLFGRGEEPSVESRLRSLMGGLDLRLWSQGGVMRLMPYQLEWK
ncbi:MAG: signal peptide peptidase SppA [Bryobacteraceae bacterium]